MLSLIFVLCSFASCLEFTLQKLVEEENFLSGFGPPFKDMKVGLGGLVDKPKKYEFYYLIHRTKGNIIVCKYKNLNLKSRPRYIAFKFYDYCKEPKLEHISVDHEKSCQPKRFKTDNVGNIIDEKGAKHDFFGDEIDIWSGSAYCCIEPCNTSICIYPGWSVIFKDTNDEKNLLGFVLDVNVFIPCTDDFFDDTVANTKRDAEETAAKAKQDAEEAEAKAKLEVEEIKAAIAKAKHEAEEVAAELARVKHENEEAAAALAKFKLEVGRRSKLILPRQSKKLSQTAAELARAKHGK